MAITGQTLRLAEQLRAQLGKVSDRQRRQIVAAYARGWDDVAGELDDALQVLAANATDGRISRAQLTRTAQLTRALDVIGRQLRDLADEAGVLVIGDLDEVVQAAGRAQDRLIRSQLPNTRSARELVTSWSRVDERAVQAIVVRSAGQITARTRPLSAEATAAMKRELARGIAIGSSPTETARRMLLRTEGLFLGGANRAMTIATTEMLDAHRAAARLSRQANADVLTGWQWSAQLDTRTCPSCWSQHGSVHPADEPGPLDHPRGRCAAIPLTRSWRDLGIDLDEPPSVMPDAQAVFRALGEDEQLAIMGRTRLDALTGGRASWEDLSVRRSADGWRDSYSVRPARDLVGA